MKEAYEHTAASFFAKMLKLHLGVESATSKIHETDVKYLYDTLMTKRVFERTDFFRQILKIKAIRYILIILLGLVILLNLLAQIWGKGAAS